MMDPSEGYYRGGKLWDGGTELGGPAQISAEERRTERDGEQSFYL